MKEKNKVSQGAGGIGGMRKGGGEGIGRGEWNVAR